MIKKFDTAQRNHNRRSFFRDFTVIKKNINNTLGKVYTTNNVYFVNPLHFQIFKIIVQLYPILEKIVFI